MKRRLSRTGTTVVMDSGLAASRRPGMTSLLAPQLLVLRFGALCGGAGRHPRCVSREFRPLRDHLEPHAEADMRAGHHLRRRGLLAPQPWPPGHGKPDPP